MPRLAQVAGALAFVALATLNSGGYRYGAADQAFYIPAILDRLDPALFPRDSALLGPQARYFFVDEIVAAIVGATGWSIEACFAAGYVLSLLVLYAGLWRLGAALYTSPLATWAAGRRDAATPHHEDRRQHARGLLPSADPRLRGRRLGPGHLSRGRPYRALALVAVAGLLHPTTAAFFVLVLVAAMLISEPAARPALGVATVAGAAGLAWLLFGPMRSALDPMDPAWQALIGTKDYLFPTRDWRADAWLANLGTAAIALGTLAWRVRSAHRPREAGLLAGAAVLLAGFLATLPLVAMGSAFFVQLQISRSSGCWNCWPSPASWGCWSIARAPPRRGRSCRDWSWPRCWRWPWGGACGLAWSSRTGHSSR